MKEDERPDPDALLRAIQQTEIQSEKGGYLRVFFGMAAGVGKTYSMLRAANERLKEGVDVVIGVAETHGRQETAELLKSLPAIPKKKIEYRGTAFEEFDIDAILERKPELVIVDELAHTNVPGSRNTKRYQDVLELLDAGISVYTAFNVQHLESRKDLVERITTIKIRETVPDSIFERANQIELVDIAPSELLKRLKEGKVYLGDKAQTAIQHFFRQDSLTALREIALRMTAERVEHELQGYLETKQSGPWQTNERLMVAVSHSPYSDKLIRATRRLAYNLEAPWIAVNINTGLRLNNEDQAQLSRNLALARELGAEVVTTTDTDIPVALETIARRKNVTQIVVGRPVRRWIRDMIEGGSLLDRLVRESWEIDVHVIRQEQRPKFRGFSLPRFNFQTGFTPYWNTFWFFCGIAFVSGMIDPFIGYRAVGFIFLLGVLTVGVIGSYGPVLFAAFLSALVWNFFFIPPRLTFVIAHPDDMILCISYFVVAVITGVLTNRIRRHEVIIREREERTNMLYEILKEISASRDKAEFLGRVTERMGTLLGGRCGVMLKDQEGKLIRSETMIRYGELSEKDLAVAQWALTSGKPAGWSTDTLSEADALNIPLKGSDEVMGVLLYESREKRRLAPDQETLLHSVCRQLALALERNVNEERLRQTERLQESEKLHQTLLNSISHEMRTPLTAIMGSATALGDEQSPNTPEFKRALASELVLASDRLNRVIENLLDMSRLNSGVLALKKEWNDVHDLIGVTLTRLGRNLDRHPMKVDIAPDLPLIEVDFRLIEHVLSNIILNAVQYTPTGTEIKISAKAREGKLLIVVEDSGPGISEAYISKIFEKFYRIPGTPTGGTGLGLSISKSIIELHKGQIKAENRIEGGSRFVISLPLAQPPEAPKERDAESPRH